MSIFDVLSLLGGLAMFLYGMRVMGSGLKENSSGALKKVLEKVTNNVFKAFLLGLLVTALIQSSTATIVITSGLVAAGLIKFKQSIGIIMGANVGTTVTGQIIRLIDIGEGGSKWLQIFKPSTLAPVALIIGIILIMFISGEKSEKIGGILMGFGILFMGLLTMTGSVDVLTESGAFDGIFSGLKNPAIGYIAGAGVAFILQSSSATIGILQAFSTAGLLTFKSIYAVLVGIYLGDCVTTAIVCSIGAKTDAKRVGIANILFNLSETVLVLVGVTIAHSLGLLDGIWNSTINSGVIANTNTIFNLGCSVLLFPLHGVYAKLSCLIIKDQKVEDSEKLKPLEGLNPVFFSTPAIAFRSVYDALNSMFDLARSNITRAISELSHYDEKIITEINADEEIVDRFTDEINDYLLKLSANVSSDQHAGILDQYYKVVSEFERLSDHAVNITETAAAINAAGTKFSDFAMSELAVLTELLNNILDYTKAAFENRDENAAKHIEPLEEVVDDMINALRDNHLRRMREGKCNPIADASFSNLMNDLERISDICSNIGVATIVRVDNSLKTQAHSYISRLHTGNDEDFNTQYQDAHDKYFQKLAEIRG